MSFTDVFAVKYSLMELQAVPHEVNLPMHKLQSSEEAQNWFGGVLPSSSV